MNRKALWVGGMLLCGFAAAAQAQFALDARPVKVILPFAPGGSTDVITRVVAQQINAQSGAVVTIDYRTGGGGLIGYGAAAKAAPDGYTLCLVEPSLTILPGLYKSMPFDVNRDFSAITQVLHVPLALLVPAADEAKSVKDLVARAQRNPGKLNFGSAGTGSLLHLAAELFKTSSRLDMVHVPYKGSGDAIAALLGGQIQLYFSTVSTATPSVRAGKLRALAVTTNGERAAALPEIPSMAEAGLPGMAVYGWFGFSGPAGMPADVLARWHGEMVKALAVPAVREKLLAQGGDIVGNSQAEFSALIRTELRRWGEVIKAAGITPE